MTEKVIRSVDLVSGGADELQSFINNVLDNEGKTNAQALIKLETDDGVEIDKAELIFDGDFYVIRLSGL